MNTYNYETQLRQAALMIGANDFTGQQGMTLLGSVNRFVQTRYSLKPEEIIEAFELACARRLHHSGRPLDPDSFGKTLHSNLAGKVLSAYLVHKKEIQQSKQVYHDHSLKRISNEDAWELVLKWAKEEGKPTAFAPYIGAYRYLLEKGQIEPVKKPTTRVGMAANIDSQERKAVEKYLMKTVLKQTAKT